MPRDGEPKIASAPPDQTPPGRDGSTIEAGGAESAETLRPVAPPTPPLASAAQAPTLSRAPQKENSASPNAASPTLMVGGTMGTTPMAGGSGRASAGTGAMFGDYQLIETIAKGGMGVVYKARQRKLNRIVAIKMILAGQFADKSDVDRFYAEAEAAAALSHPNIVAIHEIGEVDGQHFFSMEYIEGQSLAALVQESPLPPRRAAEFVKTIAETMEFAHERGIVHRDLKPSNILLDRQDRPLITDFGLAKQVANQGQSQLTMAGTVVGTPSYMPPEQAAGKGDDVGPWSDLYSLGAILYELITGRPPFRAASPFETIRQVLENEPLSPRLVNSSVPRDLETICLKCLQKERSRRYTSSQELADELGRFLRGEPINARPISRVARFWRMCRRNPATASAIAVALLLLITTAVVATGGYVTTSRALAQSEQSRRDAMAVVDELFTRVSEDTLLNQPGMQPLRKDLLERALRYYQKFLQQRANDPAMQDELASSYFRIGLITDQLESPDRALPSYETALQMQEKLLARRPDDPALLEAFGNTLIALGTVRTKKRDFDVAREHYGEAVRIRKQLAAKNPADSEYQRGLANAHMNMGVLKLMSGELSEAREELALSQEIRKAALERDSSNLKLMGDLAKGSFNLGDLDRRDGDSQARAQQHFLDAAALFERIVALEPGDLNTQTLLARSYRLLGDLSADTDANEARRRYEQAFDRLNLIAKQNPKVNQYQVDLAAIKMNLAYVERANPEASIAALEEAQAILSPLVTQFPSVAVYQFDLALTLRELAVRKANAEQFADARDNRAEAIRLLAGLVEQYPEDLEYQAELEKTKDIALDALPPPQPEAR